MLIIPDRGLEYPGFNSRHLTLPPQVALSDDPLARGIVRSFPLNNWQSRSLNTYTIDSAFTPEVEVSYNDIVYEEGRPEFNGSTSYVSLCAAHHIREDTSRALFTLSLRCKPYVTTGTQYIFGGLNAYPSFLIFGGEFIWAREATTALVIDTEAVVANQEYILTAVHDFNKLIDGINTNFFYVNDRLAGVSASTSGFSWLANPFLIGKRQSNTDYFIGQISDVNFWARGLSHGEISAYVSNPRRIYRPVV